MAPGRVQPIVLTGKRFEVHVHFDDIWVAKSALETVEAVWPVAMEFLESPGTEPNPPLEVHIYPTQEAYAEVESILTDGWFQNTGSFAHWNSKTAHVAMAPPLAGPAAERIVLSAQTREALLHEAAHLATYVVIPTYRWHPRWFSEGLAMGVEQETARRLGLLGEPGEHPRYATDQVLLQRLQEHDSLPSVPAILGESLESYRFHERYAIQLEFFWMLRENHRDEYWAMIRAAKVLPGGGAFPQGLAEFMRDTFDVSALERELRKRVAALAPGWYLDYRAFQVNGDLWTQAAFPGTPARAWRTAPVNQGTYALVGECELLGPEMSVLLNHAGWDFVAVRLRAEGAIVVQDVGAESTVELARAQCAVLRQPGAHRFRVEVDGARLAVEVDGELRLELELEEAYLGGPWGLAVPAGGAGLWRGVELQR